MKKIKEMQEKSSLIKVTVIRKPHEKAIEWAEDFAVKTTDKIASLLEKVQRKRHLQPPMPPSSRWGFSKMITLLMSDLMNEDTTFVDNNISSDAILYIFGRA